jgi:hypothetical protein
MWYSESPTKIATAKSICSSCPVKDMCYDLAIKNNEMDGVWGGVNFSDPKERPEFEVKLCKKKIHPNPDGGMCIECRKLTRKKFDAKRVRNYKGTHVRKQVGDLCANGHKIEGDNLLIRPYDNANTCKMCNTAAGKKKQKIGSAPIILPKGVR